MSEDRYRYPLTGVGLALAQTSFFLPHLPLVVGVAAALLLPPVRGPRTARVTTGTAP